MAGARLVLMPRRQQPITGQDFLNHNHWNRFRSDHRLDIGTSYAKPPHPRGTQNSKIIDEVTHRDAHCTPHKSADIMVQTICDQIMSRHLNKLAPGTTFPIGSLTQQIREKWSEMKSDSFRANA
jgi:hypothetical protein